MNRTSILAVWFLCLAAEMVHAQQTSFVGKMSGIQLTISLSNNVIAVGSTNYVHCSITNASTNAIILADTGGPKVDFDFSLIDGSGKVHNFKPPGPRVIFRNVSIDIPPGGKYESELEIRLDKTIKPGRYRLEVKRRFLFGNGKKSRLPGWQEVVSNLLDLEVK